MGKVQVLSGEHMKTNNVNWTKKQGEMKLHPQASGQPREEENLRNSDTNNTSCSSIWLLQNESIEAQPPTTIQVSRSTDASKWVNDQS